MNNFTEEQLERLKPYDTLIRQVMQSQCFTGVTTDEVEELREIYEESQGVRREVKTYCGYCVMDLIQDIGRVYLPQLERMAENKRGRKKKSDQE